MADERERRKRQEVGEESGRLPFGVPPAVGRDGDRNATESAKRKTDDEWLAFATEDPAFFIKPSDAV